MINEAHESSETAISSQRVFVAPSVTAAMNAVRREMGDHAVIVQVRKRNGEENLVEVIASEDPQESPVAEVITQSRIDPDLLKRTAFMLEQNFAPSLQARLLSAVERLLEEEPELDENSLLRELLGREIVRLDFADERHPAMPILLFGPAGAGKTSAAMKYAVQLRLLEEPLRIFNLDSQRLGNRHTLTNFAKLINCKAHHTGAKAALKKLKAEQEHFDIIDTPAVNPHNDRELQQTFAPFQGHGMYRILVLSAMCESTLMQRMIDAFSRHVTIDGLVLTHLDLAQNYTKVLNVLMENGLPLAGVSETAEITQSLMQTPEQWVEAISCRGDFSS